MHTLECAVHSVQLCPPVPQAVSLVPGWQVPFASQHPAGHVVGEQVAWLQTMIGSVGRAASGPHVFPGAHSAVDEQSWIGPMAVGGHGATRQLVVI